MNTTTLNTVKNAISALIERLGLHTHGEVIETQTQITVRFDNKYFNFSAHNDNGVIIFLDNEITAESHPNIKDNGVPVSFADWHGQGSDVSDERLASYTSNKARIFLMQNF